MNFRTLNKNKIISFVFVWLIASVNLYSRKYQSNDISFFNSFLIEFIAPLQRGSTNVKDTVVNFFNHYVFIVETSKTNAKLKKEIEQLKDDVFKLEQIKKENSRLKELLKFGEEIKRQKLLAQVIGWDAKGSFKILRINKGSNSGIKVNSPVITSQGVVGHIYQVTPNYSDVLTILDQNNKVDAIVDRTRSHGILEGLSGNLLKMKYVVRNEPVEEGDLIITAGLGDLYPKGIKVGKIQTIKKRSYDITQYIEVEPFVNFNKLEEVIVLLGNTLN